MSVLAEAFDIAPLVVVAADLSEVLSVEGDGEVVEELGDVSGGLVAEFVGHEEVGHDVIIEDVRDGAPDIDYPAFVAGERRCPPEDVGGAPGFMQFLEAALNPFHDEHEEVLTWYGKPFDPNDIDERYLRMALTTIANRRRGALMRHRASAQ